MNKKAKDILRQGYEKAKNKSRFINSLREFIHKELSPLSTQPIDLVRWIPVGKISANDYNPNSVAGKEMSLLYTSIKHDGYTQPIVTVYDPKKDIYVIVDGFHRYHTCINNQDILNRNKGMLPIVVIDKDINERMAATVRHNRARGKHSIKGMSSMVFDMLENGWKDEDICNELGMEPEEILRLKHITGYSKLFADVEYARSWKSKKMIQFEQAQKQDVPRGTLKE